MTKFTNDSTNIEYEFWFKMKNN